MYKHLIHTLYVSNVANFELTEINNIFKCFGEGVPQKRANRTGGKESKNRWN